jgi:3-oxoacyl-[acyl-carrier-protein] synthase-3
LIIKVNKGETILGITITKTGKALPRKIVTNDEMAALVDTNHDWIVERTGIHQRHVAVEESNLELALKASEEALIGTDRNTVDLVIFSTITPDRLVPCMGSLLKRELGLHRAVAFDLNAACSGFIFGVWTAEALMKSNGYQKALVVGAECLSRITNWEDRGTCVLFGDGAGVALLEDIPNEPGILSSYVMSYDDPKEVLACGMLYPKTPFEGEGREEIPMHITMNGTQVFKFAVNAIGEVMQEAIHRANLTYQDIDFFVPHQANMRIIQSAAQKTGQPLEKFQISIKNTGNVSSASVPMALDDLMKTGKIKKGNRIMLMGFGGGLSAGAMIYQV